jgi:hypothetical protein
MGRSFVVPQSTFKAGKDGWVHTEGGGFKNIIYRPKADKPVIVRFLTNPLDPPVRMDDDGNEVNTDWVTYREVGAFDGMIGGYEMKGGPYEFPVFDLAYTADGQRMSAPRGTDLLFESVLPKPQQVASGFTRAQANDMVAFNAIVIDGEWGQKKAEFNPQPGQHIVMKLTGDKARSLLLQLETKMEEHENLDPMTGGWQIHLVGADRSQTLMLTRKTKGIDELDYEPDLIDIPGYLNEIRDAAEAKWDEIRGATDVEETFTDDDDDDLVDEFEEKVAAAPSTDYTVMSPARLKKLLVDAGVEIPARATTAKLIELATTSL